MSDLPKFDFHLRANVERYLSNGPPAFTPGHAGLLQMAGGCCQSKVNLSPPGAGRVGWSKPQAMTARHSARAAERLSL